LMMPAVTSTRSDSTNLRALARPTSGLPSASSCSISILRPATSPRPPRWREAHAVELASPSTAKHPRSASSRRSSTDRPRAPATPTEAVEQWQSAGDFRMHGVPPDKSLLPLPAAYQPDGPAAKLRTHVTRRDRRRPLKCLDRPFFGRVNRQEAATGLQS
jgi:hypothetical protein